MPKKRPTTKSGKPVERRRHPPQWRGKARVTTQLPFGGGKTIAYTRKTNAFALPKARARRRKDTLGDKPVDIGIKSGLSTFIDRRKVEEVRFQYPETKRWTKKKKR